MNIEEFLHNVEYLLKCTLTDEQREAFAALASPILEANEQVEEVDEEERMEARRQHWADRMAIERDYPILY